VLPPGKPPASIFTELLGRPAVVTVAAIPRPQSRASLTRDPQGYVAPGEIRAALPPAVQLLQIQQRALGGAQADSDESGPAPKLRKLASGPPAAGTASGRTECSQLAPAQDPAGLQVVAQPALGAELREAAQRHRPPQFSTRDAARINTHAENARLGVVHFTSLQRPAEGYRPLQRRLLAIETPTDYQEVVRQRRMEVLASLSDKYMLQRVSVLRCWEQALVEAHQENPWRLHWPADYGDDQIMGGWLLINSCRWTSFSVVESAMMHVIEFHCGYLGVSPPPFTWSRWLLKKLELCMAGENPEGRRHRPGLTSDDVSAICAKIWGWVCDDQIPLGWRQFYVNCGAAIAATFTPALRTGETCPGEEWNPTHYWSRQRVGKLLDPAVLGQAGVESVLIKAMKRKTLFRSAVARSKAMLPIMYDAKSTTIFAFARWGPKLQELDSCEFGKEHVTPAFRTGGADSPALSVDILWEFMRSVAKDTIPDWDIHDFGCHSLRIGREAMLRLSGARPETINDVTSHTTTAGRAPYSRLEHDDALAAHRAADAAKAKPVERMIMDADGSLIVGGTGQTSTSAATGARAAGAGGAQSLAAAAAPEAGTAPPLSKGQAFFARGYAGRGPDTD
jgi:hypothetical protein